MGGMGRMEIAREALSIFIRSLPAGCKFSIISFGSAYDAMVDADEQTILSYTDQTKELALKKIESFESDYGGTEILMPLMCA